ncbi:MAG TPA: PhzF family phenazine biosynthesis protein [Mesorhizobium sp.]|jgi:trans-2,3-dihydro-3-hydroxyanthranilate isomerase|nr:PhzF family phenazine biosynthesis protein [Mesorhizobium sp.]
MNARRYLVLDVFTREVLQGNPLAVVLDAEGLSTERMQAIANEFHLSETTFVLPPEDRRHRAQVRIFTPLHELPFAGHPTVGTAVALAGDAGVDAILVLEETVGPVRCAVTHLEGTAFAEFDLPRLPEPVLFEAGVEAVAAALELGTNEIGAGHHSTSAWTAGVPYVCIPVRDLEALGRARLDVAAWVRLIGSDDGHSAAAYVYCPTGSDGFSYRSRMFAGHVGITEDPATGSAAAAFAGAMMKWERPGEGIHRIAIEQGMEMGRPSQIRLELVVGPGGGLEAARIGGFAIRIAEGVLFA